MKEYQYYTHVCGGDINNGPRTQYEVDQYYTDYGRNSFIWHKTWNDACNYCIENYERQLKKHKDQLISIKKDIKILKLEKKLRNLK